MSLCSDLHSRSAGSTPSKLACGRFTASQQKPVKPESERLIDGVCVGAESVYVGERTHANMCFSDTDHVCVRECVLQRL